jgi:hypothetical protein
MQWLAKTTKKNYGYGSQMTGQESNLMRIHDSLCGREYLFYGFFNHAVTKATSPNGRRISLADNELA